MGWTARGALRRVWDVVREALRGTTRDYTEGPIGRALLLLAVPMILETLLESLFAVVDIFFVAHLGADAIATVGLTESMMSLIYAVAIGLGVGAAAIVARRIGEHDAARASHAGAQAILLGVLVSLPVSAVGLTVAPGLLRVLGASAAVQGSGAGYVRLLLGGNVAVLLLFLINAVFRGAGDATIAMRSLWLASGANMLLSPLFIFGVGPFPRLGVTGAAVGTTIGRSIGVLYQLRRLARHDGRLTLRARDFVPDWRSFAALIRLSGSGVLQILIGTTSWLALIRVLAPFGSVVLAGYTIAMRVVVFALLPSWGLSNAAATMVGQNLGAKQPDRAERTVWLAAWYDMWVLGAIGVAFELAAPAVIALFTPDPAIAHTGVVCLRIVASAFVFYAYELVVANAFNGAGDTWTPTVLNLVCFWGIELPLAWALSRHTALGPAGVFVSIAAAFSCLAVASGLIFRLGRWKSRVV